MGMIKIETVGSFPNQTKTFSAMQHGHADAVAKAITWLSDERTTTCTIKMSAPKGPSGAKAICDGTAA
jgi:hypothetical protein